MVGEERGVKRDKKHYYGEKTIKKETKNEWNSVISSVA